MRNVKLVRSVCLGNWYVLEGGNNWACIEGEYAEWHLVAHNLVVDGPDATLASFRRLCVRRLGGRLIAWSPRNARSEEDYVTIASPEELSKQILRLLSESCPDCPKADS